MEAESCEKLLLEAVNGDSRRERISIDDAWGRVCAETVYAPFMVPPFPKSAMDGYAVKAEEIKNAARECPVKLTVAGELCAGDFALYDRKPMTAVRVMTGAPVPEGFDAVVRQEDTDYGQETVSVYRPVAPYTNYCKAGEDITEGQCVVERGVRLTSVHIGLLASLGVAYVEAVKPFQTAVIATGSELCAPGEKLGPGQIYDSISHMLCSSIRREGLALSGAWICADEEELFLSRLREACSKADVVITVGGVSVGKKDIVPLVLKKLGAREIFRGVDIQPGTPTMASILGDTVILSLSGNPYAALAHLGLFFWPLAAKLMGSKDFLPRRETAVFSGEYAKVNKRRRLLRALAAEGHVELPSGIHASSVIHNLADCNCFIDLEAGRCLHQGDTVKIRYFKGE